MADILDSLGTSGMILSLSIILFSGFLFTRITKKLHLPNVTGYILTGIILGPFVLHIIPDHFIRDLDFITDTALAFIAFGVGKYFKLSALKKNGKQVLIVTIFESLGAGIIITITMIYIFHLPVSFSLLLGAIGCATAPASTIMTIRQYHAKGPFVDMVLQVTALDDAVALIAFSISTAFIQSINNGDSMNLQVFILPIIYNIIALFIGGSCGYALHRMISDKRSSDHKLVIVIAIILLLSGICTMLNISPLLSCMVLGTVYINLSSNKDLFRQVNAFTPPILLLFFVVSGMNLNMHSLMEAGIIGIGYFIVRILGKMIGSYTGCHISHTSSVIQKNLGYALIPQAGVSIGLAALGQRLLPTSEGILLSTIILSSAVLYEMIGPACAKYALLHSDSVKDVSKDNSIEKTSSTAVWKTNSAH